METLRAVGGGGLAAVQVGVLTRVAVVDMVKVDGTRPLLMVDPVVTWTSTETAKDSEGCLSIPGPRELVLRPLSVSVTV